MKNVCKVVFKSDEIIKNAGLNPDTAVITNINKSEFDGRIEITIRSAVAVEGVTVESESGSVRVKKLDIVGSVATGDNEKFMSNLGTTLQCELCEIDKATTTVEYRDVIYKVCERCKALAENE